MEKSTDIQKCYINDTDHALLSWDSYHLSIYTLTSTNYPKQGVHMRMALSRQEPTPALPYARLHCKTAQKQL